MATKTAKKTAITRIHWKPEEREALADRAAIAMRNGQAKKPVEALRLAQEVLAEDRRREIAGVGNTTEAWFPPMLAAALRKLQKREIEEAAKPAAPPPAPAVQEVAAEPSEALEAITPPKHLNGTAVEPANGFAGAVPPAMGQALLNLRGMLVDELASVFLEAMLKAIGSGLLTHGETPQVQVDQAHGVQRLRIAPKVHKPSILIVGVRNKNGGHKEVIEREYGDRFDLRFIGADESKDQLRSMTEQADTTVVLTGSISHNFTDIVKARSPKYVFSDGTSLSALRQTLTNLAH